MGTRNVTLNECAFSLGADERVRRAEHATVRAISDEAQALRESGRDTIVGTKGRKGEEQEVRFSDLLEQWARASEAANRLATIAKHAACYLDVAPSELDADPFKINVLNGTLVAAKREGDYVSFHPHRPADLITKLAPVVYDPNAACPRFHEFLGYVQPREDNRIFLRQWKGHALTGDTGEQKLAIFWGKGKNGKSTFEDVVAHVAGDYCDTIPIETFLDQGRGRNAGQATPDLALLPGVRMLRTSEPEKGAKLAEAFIKLATGGEPIQARHLHHDYFKFYPQFKLTVSGQHRTSLSAPTRGSGVASSWCRGPSWCRRRSATSICRRSSSARPPVS